MNLYEQDVAEFAAAWSLRHSPHTAKTYTYWLRRYSADTDNLTLALPDCTAWLTTLRASAPGGAWMARRALRAFSKWRAAVLDADDVLHRLPSFPQPPVSKERARVLSAEDYSRLITACRQTQQCETPYAQARDEAIVRVLWSTGMRRGEIADLTWDRVDLLNGLVNLEVTKTLTSRLVPLDTAARLSMRAYMRTLMDSDKSEGDFSTGAVWIGTKGTLTRNGLAQAVKRRGELAGIKSLPHDFRRAFATNWLADGGSETLLMAAAGWKSHEMVARYTSADRNRLALAEHKRLEESRPRPLCLL